MSDTPDGRFEEHERQLGDPVTAAAAPTTDANPAEASPGTAAKPEEEALATGARTSTTVTPAEYILSTMIPLKPPAEEEELVFPGKRERASTGGSSGSGARLMSMDLNLSSGDIVMDGGLAALNSDDAMMHLKSADVVEKIILPDTATTAAAAALGAEQLPEAPISEDLKPPSLEARQEGEDGFCPIVSLTAKLERISTGEEIAPLGENFRMSSRDWVKDFADETGDLGPMRPSLFMGSPDAVPSAPPLDASWRNDEQFEVPLQSPGNQPMPPVPPLSNANVIHNMPRSLRTTRSSLKAKSPSSSTASKKKRRRKRDIDLTRAVDPTDDDVLFGRGGYSNQHPGNIRFREKAMELRPWYEAVTTTKEEKYRISELLVESVKSEGHRFLEKGEDGLWHEVIGNGARKKASQALRERIKGTRRTKGTASSIRSSASQGSASQGGVADFTVDDVIGDLQPASVEGV